MDNKHSFKNNFDEFENQKYDNGFQMIFNLLSKEQREIIAKRLRGTTIRGGGYPKW